MPHLAEFRKLCRAHGLAATHQRQLIYETVMSLPGHPSADGVYDIVRQEIPAISLATVYKNIRVFLERGIFHEVSFHHGSLRVEPNLRPHHHVVCVRCRSISDLDEAELEPVQLKHKVLRGFEVQRFAVDVLGICQSCSGKEQKFRK